jgi:hypothetical protein
MAELYETDILLWSERQGDLLRRLGRGERVNDQIDWENVAEEVEAVGRSERRACESFILQALLHDLKMKAWPQSPQVPHWRIEAHAFRYEAAKAFAPSMRQRIDVAALYREAVRRLPPSIDGQPPLPVPEACALTLDEILTETE